MADRPPTRSEVPSGPGAGPRHLAELVAAAARRDPEHPAVVDADSGRTLSWAELAVAVDAESARLRARGVAAGDRVVVRLVHGPDFCVALLGALRAGAVAVPVGPGAVARELQIVMDDCAPAAVVAAPDDATVTGLRGLGDRLVGPPDPAATGGPTDAGPDPAGGEEIALLVYTSGATGVPRGVRLSHRAVLANRAQTAALRPAPVTPTDRVLLALPLFHIFGLGAGLLQVCWAGATAVLVDDLEAGHTADVLVSHRVSTVAGVPSTYRAWLDLPPDRLRAAFAGVRLCTAGGAPLLPRWLDAFHAATGLEVFEGYGLSEAGPVLTTNQVAGVAKPGSVGRPLPGIELRLVDAAGVPLDEAVIGPVDGADDWADDDPAGVDGADTGLVAARGANLFSGYWPDGADGPDDEGWFRTGDVGYFDADGDLHLVDRASDVVIVSGFNVFPREVEQVLTELPGIAEAAVVGIPDDRTGEAVKAVLVAAPGAAPTLDEVHAHCATRLARFKRPASVEFVAALPHSATGKIARRMLGGEPK